MKKRKLLSVILSGVLLFPCFPIQPVTAESNDVDVWDGTYDTSWYDEDEKEVHIHTAEQFAGIFKHSTKGMTFYLETDIALTETGKIWNEWQAGNMDGLFYGQDHMISGLYKNSLFYIIGEDAVVKDLKVETASYSHSQAIFAGKVSGEINNCTVAGDISLDIEPVTIRRDRQGRINIDVNSLQRGGFCNALIGGTIRNCKSNANIDIKVHLDSIRDVHYNNALIQIYYPDSNDSRYGSTFGLFSVGGISGVIKDGSAVVNCCNYGDIQFEMTAGTTMAGPAFYYFKACSAMGCIDSGKVLIENCYNYIAECPLVAAYKGSNAIIRNSYNVGNSFCSLYEIPEPPVCTNCYYQSGIDTSQIKKIEGVKEKSKNNMQKKDFAVNLGSAFVYVENEYPLLAWELGILLGDVNLDEKVDIADVVELQKILYAETVLADDAAYLADLDYNGIINGCDLTLLKRMLIYS